MRSKASRSRSHAPDEAAVNVGVRRDDANPDVQPASNTTDRRDRGPPLTPAPPAANEEGGAAIPTIWVVRPAVPGAVAECRPGHARRGTTPHEVATDSTR